MKIDKKNPDFTYWNSVFRDIFCSLQGVPLDTPDFFYEDMLQTLLDHWELISGAMVFTGKYLDF